MLKKSEKARSCPIRHDLQNFQAPSEPNFPPPPPQSTTNLIPQELESRATALVLDEIEAVHSNFGNFKINHGLFLAEDTVTR